MTLPASVFIELFNPEKFSIEKVSFQLGNRTFHVGEGDMMTRQGIDFDGLGTSPIWRHQRTNQEYRKKLWEQIQRYLPQLKTSTLEQVKQRRSFNGYEFLHILRMAQAYNKYRSLQIVHTGDSEHAELIARCTVWLAAEISR
jgi:hypothetical protein